ncbi:hypothetical protein GLAREA_08507 [Glarea lozoyensis ATCC 20868]|uniref:2EXR domain-containing protein n=1 Tax=Glarea lozoyensis (strain ATCC 20868 / MF5171) TaxID=1116229 RepID=S3CH80_GLAL2|nr:uncharacterized protein GLAREA_08507 [Glarea lozoyensis ATCC 20868]EPE24654.1 hypothetical protein GLAREA_08507 [Glarea lozoyensis ATCC 20868]
MSTSTENNDRKDIQQTIEFERFPLEIQDQIWESTCVPRNIFIYEIEQIITIDEGLGERYNKCKIHQEVGDCYNHQPIALSGNYRSRDNLPRRYERILEGDLPNSWIYFNFDIDTLVIHPQMITRHFVPIDGTDQQPSWGLKEQFKILGPNSQCGQTMLRGKQLLKGRNNNLERIQFIAIGGFRWWNSETVLCGKTKSCGFDLQKFNFEAGIKHGFQNLKELILVLAKEKELTSAQLDSIPPGIGLRTEEGKEICRREITEMYKAEKARRPGFKIPKIIFLEHEDPKAPNFDFGKQNGMGTKVGTVPFGLSPPRVETENAESEE